MRSGRISGWDAGEVMTARDELAKVIFADHVSDQWGDIAPEIAEVCEAVADLVLAAGYVKPRVITTLEELDALPRLSVVQVQVGKTAETWVHEGRHALHFMGGRVAHGDDRARFLPLTVLWEPTS